MSFELSCNFYEVNIFCKNCFVGDQSYVRTILSFMEDDSEPVSVDYINKLNKTFSNIFHKAEQGYCVKVYV